MSIETIATHINSYEEPEANSLELTSEQTAKIEETPHERRLRLHRELAAIIPELHDLQTRHDTLTGGLLQIARKFRPAPLPRKARTKMTERKRMALQSEHRKLQSELRHAHATLRQEQTELARNIHEKREKQGHLIAEAALTNTTITRPRPPESHEEYEANPHWKQQRDDIEHPLSIHLHYGGEDPRELTTPSHDPTDRYLKNTAA